MHHLLVHVFRLEMHNGSAYFSDVNPLIPHFFCSLCLWLLWLDCTPFCVGQKFASLLINAVTPWGVLIYYTSIHASFQLEKIFIRKNTLSGKKISTQQFRTGRKRSKNSPAEKIKTTTEVWRLSKDSILVVVSKRWTSVR